MLVQLCNKKGKEVKVRRRISALWKLSCHRRTLDLLGRLEWINRRTNQSVRKYVLIWKKNRSRLVNLYLYIHIS